MKPGDWKKGVTLSSLCLAWVLIAFLLIHLFGGSTGYPAQKRLEQRITNLEQQNKTLTDENLRLWEVIKYRKTSEYLEEMVRTELHHLKKGETLVILPSPTPTQTVSSE